MYIIYRDKTLNFNIVVKIHDMPPIVTVDKCTDYEYIFSLN